MVVKNRYGNHSKKNNKTQGVGYMPEARNSRRSAKRDFFEKPGILKHKR